MSSERDYTRQINGILAMTITDLDTGIIRAQRLPTNAKIDDNPEVKKIMGNDSLGRETNIGSYITAFKPVLTLSYSGEYLDLNALKKGRKIQTIAFDNLILPKEMQVTKAEYLGITTGKVGFGIPADATASASTLSETLESVELTQQPFDTFDPTELNSYAIGENFARKFSTDLVARRAFVHIEVPMASAKSARYLTEDTIGPQKIEILAKSTNDTVTLVRIPQATIDPSGTGFDPKAENIDIVFDLSGLGVCDPYSMYELTDTIYCDR
ncbi:MAG: hypothetical protein HC836_48500 [Richelia sp. RM2_1_2]|nr:hypothetical protein [Richelia sp. RM1_1_1]NJO65647.1 hypothetical protein [Richelia sp. RM2_1_2]